MKKSIIRNVLIVLACFLGIGGLFGVATTVKKEAKPVYAANDTLMAKIEFDASKAGTVNGFYISTGGGTITEASNFGSSVMVPNAFNVPVNKIATLRYQFPDNVKVGKIRYDFVLRKTASWNPTTTITTSCGNSEDYYWTTTTDNRVDYDTFSDIPFDHPNSCSLSFDSKYSVGNPVFNDFVVSIYYLDQVDITFDKQGGSGGTDSLSDVYAKTPKSLMQNISVPTRTGYIFEGYYSSTEGEGTNYYDANGNFVPDTWNRYSDTTLYAKWKLNTYNVSFNVNNTNYGSVSSSSIANVPSGSTISVNGNKVTINGTTVTATPESETGYTLAFSSWSNASGTVTSARTITANFTRTANKYEVTFNKDGGSGGSDAVDATYNSAMPNITVPTRPGYTFQGYYDTSATTGGKQYYTSTGASARNWDKTADTTLWARWNVINYTITYNLNGGSVSGTNPTSYNVTTPTFTLINPTKLGYSFKGWSGTGLTGDENTNVSVAQGSINNRTYTAYWTLLPEIQEVIDAIDDIGSVVKLSSQSLIETAETLYEDLNDSYKFLVSNHQALLDARTAYDFCAQIDALDSYTDTNSSEYKDAVNEARNVYLDLSEGEKSFISNGCVADYVDHLIIAIGAPSYTDACKEAIDKAREAYDSLTDLQKYLVTEYNTLTWSEYLYDLAHTSKTAALEIDALIEAIGEVEYTEDCKALIDAAREAYDNASRPVKLYVEKLGILEEAEETYDRLAAEYVDNLIDLIPEEITLDEECKDAIDAAREAYDALSDEQKELVEDLEDLEEAEEAYNNLVTIETVEELIDLIPEELTLDEECKAAIEEARAAYEALSDEQKELIEDLDVLEAAEEAYDNLAADNVDGLIDAIPEEITLDDECKDAINEAREAYEELNDHQKELVDNFEDLEEAEEAYDNLVADEVENLIDAIPDEITLDDEVKEAIDEAREAYEELNDHQKELVDNLEDLENAEKEYEDHVTANEVENLIDAIPEEITLDDEVKEAIDEAREAYAELTDHQKELVDNLEELEDAEKTYDDLFAANDVDELIDAIPDEITLDDECKDAIDAAREAYDALTDDQKALVKNLEDLEAAEEAYNNTIPVESVEELIDLIPEEITLDDECKEAIETAREAYESLSDEQKELIENLDVLEAAEEAYDNLAADNVDELIETIPDEITLDEEVKEAIDEAREAYEELTDHQKELVDNLEELEEAEEAYDNLAADKVDDLIDAIPEEIILDDEVKDAIEEAREAYEELTDHQKELVDNLEDLEEAEKTYDDLFAANEVDELIDAIPDEITLDDEVKEAIDEAREAYDDLTNDQKELVEKYEDLEEAEKTYDDLFAANEVDELIDAIPDEITLDAEVKEAIDEAREAYDDLTNDQKALVKKYEDLEDAEEAYDTLDYNSAIAAIVDSLIDDIGEVKYNSRTRNAIEAARSAYDALNDDQKALVEKLDVLVLAEETYNNLKVDHEAAEIVDDLIADIGKVKYNDRTKRAIETAREAYDALTDNQKALVRDLDVLERAEEEYNRIKVDYEAAEAVDALIDNIKNIKYDDVTRNAIGAARSAYDALTSTQKELVEHLPALETAEAAYNVLKENYEAAEAVEVLINAINVPNPTKEAIDAARRAYNRLNDKQKALVKNYEKLETAERNYKNQEWRPWLELGSNVFILVDICLAVITLFVFCYILSFYINNKWVIVKGKAKRAHVSKKKNNEYRLVTKGFKHIRRSEGEIYNTKKEALASLEKKD